MFVGATGRRPRRPGRRSSASSKPTSRRPRRSPTRSSSTTRRARSTRCSALIYALLALAIIVSLFGIVNTLVLSITERTRELGMLRAIGTSRRQIRKMIRYEAIITAMLGGILGAALGVLLALVVSRPLDGLQAVDPGRQPDPAARPERRSRGSAPRCCPHDARRSSTCSRRSRTSSWAGPLRGFGWAGERPIEWFAGPVPSDLGWRPVGAPARLAAPVQHPQRRSTGPRRRGSRTRRVRGGRRRSAAASRARSAAPATIHGRPRAARPLASAAWLSVPAVRWKPMPTRDRGESDAAVGEALAEQRRP